MSHECALCARGINASSFMCYIVKKDKWKECRWDDELYVDAVACIAIREAGVSKMKDWQDWFSYLTK